MDDFDFLFDFYIAIINLCFIKILTHDIKDYQDLFNLRIDFYIMIIYWKFIQIRNPLF